MKKILALMAMLTLASGAQAYSYNFKLSLLNVSAGGASGNETSSTLYFVNKESGVIYTYISRNDLETKKEGVYYSGDYINNTTTASFEYNGKTYEGGAQEIKHASIEKTVPSTRAPGDTSRADLVYTIEWTSEGNVPYSAPVEDLAAILVFDTSPEKTYRFYDGIKGQYETQLAQYSTEFIGAVPEPTSGVLMLLGIAGLALKRRKVA